MICNKFVASLVVILHAVLVIRPCLSCLIKSSCLTHGNVNLVVDRGIKHKHSLLVSSSCERISVSFIHPIRGIDRHDCTVAAPLKLNRQPQNF